ncbi:unnamed protein product [Adineta ricciae]|uniref:Uncharacterized protein n=1 Tax=Adineta ricciae TaxID=249248 RepID=A0A813YND4_ADIRI|nr:unnamed protein product [Adineta ricciae]
MLLRENSRRLQPTLSSSNTRQSEISYECVNQSDKDFMGVDRIRQQCDSNIRQRGPRRPTNDRLSHDEELSHSMNRVSLPDNTNLSKERADILKQRVTIDKDIVKIIKEEKVETSRFITRDFSELMVARKGVRPAQLRVTLESYLDDYPADSKQRKALQSIINEINVGESNDDLRGKTIIEHVAAVTKTNELTATFVVYQYRFECTNNGSRELLVDALIISATQKLNVDWIRFGLEGAAIGVLGFLVNPAFGTEELVAILTGFAHLVGNYSQIQDSTTELNAKALLFKPASISGSESPSYIYSRKGISVYNSDHTTARICTNQKTVNSQLPLIIY